jgi:hypothetical protein
VRLTMTAMLVLVGINLAVAALFSLAAIAGD